MAEKHKEKINPDAIRELISQGIPMRRKEDSPSASCGEKESVEETPEEERELSEEVKRPLSRTRRRIPKGDYESLFIYRNDLKDRKTIYVARELQEKLAQDGAGALLEALRAVDPESAARLHLRDEKRILRALEVYYETGETIGAHDRKSREIPPRYDAAYIGLTFRDREDMKERIDRRVDAMVAQGLLQEVETLLQSGLPRDATALQAIGYKQFLAVAEGRATVAEAIAEVKLRSRQYAKRQLTWLRRNEAIHWILWEKTPDFSAGLQNATEFLLSAGVC